jgi:hypothetical protein
MNEIFEVMRFGAGGDAGEWEQERGGRGGGGRGFGGGRGPARGGSGMPGRGGGGGGGIRMGRGRTWPRYYPISGGGPLWSYPLAYPSPYHSPYPEPFPYVEPFPYPEPPDNGAQGELPQKFKDALATLPAARRPDYQPVGTLETAPNQRSLDRPGLYLLVFRGRDGSIKAYHGQSDNLRVRLLKHRLCARMLDVDPSKHLVYWAATPAGSGAEKPRRRQIEMDIHRIILPPPVGQGPRGTRLLTNQKLELERELLGES